jgi:hypothetical protein
MADKLFLRIMVFAVNEQFDYDPFGPDKHRLVVHAAYHVKRTHRPAPEGQLKGIFLNTFFNGAF